MLKYAIIIYVKSPFFDSNDLKELYGLADSAGYVVYDEIHQNIKKPDPNYFIGPGKTAQIQFALFDCLGNLVEKSGIGSSSFKCS